MQYPYDLPEPLMEFCEISNRFFLDHASRRNTWRSFVNYVEGLLHHPSSNLYEQLLCAVVQKDYDIFLAINQEKEISKYPALIKCLQNLLPPDSVSRQDPFSLLLSAAILIKEKCLNQEQLHILLQQFPEQQSRLLFLAYVHGLPLNWTEISEIIVDNGLCTLAIANQNNNMSQMLQKLFEQNQNILTLQYWMLIDSDAALKLLPTHPIIEEQIETLVLYGNAHLLSQNAHKLSGIPNEIIFPALKLFFNKQIRTRPGLNQDIYNRFETPDPISIKQLIDASYNSSHPYLLGQPRTPESIQELISLCTGRAVDFYRVYARHHGHH